MRRCLLATFISVSLCFAALPSAASDKVDKADKEQELRALKTKITQLQKNIGVKQDNKSAYVKQLKKIETSIGRVSQKISISTLMIMISPIAVLFSLTRMRQQELGLGLTLLKLY